MEKLRNINVRNKRVRIAGSLIVASGLVFSGAQAEGKTPYIPAPVPLEEFHPVVLNEMQEKQIDLTVNTLSPILEQALSYEEQRIQDLKLKAEEIYAIALQNSDIIKPGWANDLLIYGPIYLAVAEKNGIDWKILWINHEFETGASAVNSKAFDANSQSVYEGGMQIGPVWSEEYMDDAFSGLEYLDSLPQRHKGDARNIATAAKIIAANFKRYKDLGIEIAYSNALKLFTGSEKLAKQRMQVLRQLNNVFVIQDQ